MSQSACDTRLTHLCTVDLEIPKSLLISLMLFWFPIYHRYTNTCLLTVKPVLPPFPISYLSRGPGSYSKRWNVLWIIRKSCGKFKYVYWGTIPQHKSWYLGTFRYSSNRFNSIASLLQCISSDSGVKDDNSSQNSMRLNLAAPFIIFPGVTPTLHF